MLEVQGLTRYYGRFCALRDVSFRVDRHQVVGLLGLNGAGKSTTLKILAGLLVPSSGSVRIDGVDATFAPNRLRRRIGFLPEQPPLYDEMRVGEFLEWCGRMKGMSRAEVRRRLPEVIEICALGDVRDHVIGVLSHGFRKRVGIAQAIVHRPQLVLLDEPVSGLDPHQIVGMRRTVRALGEDATVMVSSHILSEVEQTCDRILVLDDGALVADGTEEELARRFGAGLRIALLLRGEAARVREVLDGSAAVTAADVADAGDGLVRADVSMSEDAREALVEALVRAGIGVRRLEEGAGELERIFLRLTAEADTETDTNPEEVRA